MLSDSLKDIAEVAFVSAIGFIIFVATLGVAVMAIVLIADVGLRGFCAIT